MLQACIDILHFQIKNIILKKCWLKLWYKCKPMKTVIINNSVVLIINTTQN